MGGANACKLHACIHFGHWLHDSVTGFTEYGFWPQTKCHFQNVTV